MLVDDLGHIMDDTAPAMSMFFFLFRGAMPICFANIATLIILCLRFLRWNLWICKHWREEKTRKGKVHFFHHDKRICINGVWWYQSLVHVWCSKQSMGTWMPPYTICGLTLVHMMPQASLLDVNIRVLVVATLWPYVMCPLSRSSTSTRYCVNVSCSNA